MLVMKWPGSKTNKDVRIFITLKLSCRHCSCRILFALTCLVCYLSLVLTSLNYILELKWLKDHNGTPDNEKYDKLACEDSKLLFWGTEPAIPLSISSLSAIISNETRKLHKEAWFKKLRVYRLTKHFLQLSRKNLLLLVGFFSSHCN